MGGCDMNGTSSPSTPTPANIPAPLNRAASTQQTGDGLESEFEETTLDWSLHLTEVANRPRSTVVRLPAGPVTITTTTTTTAGIGGNAVTTTTGPNTTTTTTTTTSAALDVIIAIGGEAGSESVSAAGNVPTWAKALLGEPFPQGDEGFFKQFGFSLLNEEGEPTGYTRDAVLCPPYLRSTAETLAVAMGMRNAALMDMTVLLEKLKDANDSLVRLELSHAAAQRMGTAEGSVEKRGLEKKIKTLANRCHHVLKELQTVQVKVEETEAKLAQLMNTSKDDLLAKKRVQMEKLRATRLAESGGPMMFTWQPEMLFMLACAVLGAAVADEERLVLRLVTLLRNFAAPSAFSALGEALPKEVAAHLSAESLTGLRTFHRGFTLYPLDIVIGLYLGLAWWHLLVNSTTRRN